MLHHPLIPANPDSIPVQHIFNKAFFLALWSSELPECWLQLIAWQIFFPSLVGPKLNGASYNECTLDLMNYHLFG